MLPAFSLEIFEGLNPANKAAVKLFENKYYYYEILIGKNIPLSYYCEHHFVPIIGKVHVAYNSNGQVIGLLKINRLVQYYAKLHRCRKGSLPNCGRIERSFITK